MLVLTRKTKQQVQIGPNITITILQVKGQAVRVGIEAPQDVCVLRTELADRMTDKRWDPTVAAAREKNLREAAISESRTDEHKVGRVMASANSSSRCRVSRVNTTSMSSPYPTTGPASLPRLRRRRVQLG